MRRMYVASTVYSFGLQLRMYGIHRTHFDHTGLDLLSPVISSHVTQSTAQKEKLYGGFCQAVKKSGGNIEVTVLPRWPYGGFSLYFILLDKSKGIDKCSLYFSFGFECFANIPDHDVPISSAFKQAMFSSAAYCKLRQRQFTFGVRARCAIKLLAEY